MKRQRKHYTPQEKVAILRRHLPEGVPVRHKSLKSECIRPGIQLAREDALRLIQTYVDHYNTVRLHSPIGFVTPTDMLAGRQKEIHDARDHKLAEAQRHRQLRRRSL